MIGRLVNKVRKIQFTLRFSILSIFITLLVLTTAVIIALNTLRFKHELAYILHGNMGYISQEVTRHLNAGVYPSTVAGQFSGHLIASGAVLTTPEQMVPYTYNILKILSLVQRVYWMNPDGDVITALKLADGSIRSDIYLRSHHPPIHRVIYRNQAGKIIKEENSSDFSLDPRTFIWYQQAKRDKQFFWSRIHPFRPKETGWGITAVMPILSDTQTMVGVFALNFSLTYITDYIARQNVPEGYSFVITTNENLVAYPNRPPFLGLPSQVSQGQLVNVHQINLPLINYTLDIYKKTHQSEIKTIYDGVTYLVSYRPIPTLEKNGWLVGVVIPRDYFINKLVRQNLLSIAVSSVILLLGIFLVSHLVTRVVNPIKLLVKETERIKRFELNTPIQISSQIKEIILLRDAIKAMKNGLQQFQKYVPNTLVRQLIRTGEDTRLGGVRKTLVVFFSDIENFTTIAEKLDANNLMLQMCEYFEVISQIINKEKGTIDKYIGDSVMAFWGAPIMETHPCVRSARSALLCQDKLRQLNQFWQVQNKPALATRIGIHMGEAIVGNLGSSERLNYTAIGDTINITSRLQEINKTYQTKILVTESVYDIIRDQFVLRFVDFVIMKGRLEPTRIYELLTDDIKKVSFDINAYRELYQQGFDAYQAKQWEMAILYFRKCLVVFPADTVAPIFIERCEQALAKSVLDH